MNAGHELRAHAVLGASNSYRWINCPGSVAATEGLDTTSVYAAQGTAAHTLAETVLTTIPTEGQPITALACLGTEITVGNHVFEVDEEMAEAVQLYVDTIRDDAMPEDQVFIERSFDLSSVRPGMFGTNDYLRYRPSTKRLTIYDYKNGVRLVRPEENPQLLYYALGAAQNLGLPVAEVELVIVQPNSFGPSVKRWVTDILTLVDFATVLGEAADRALEPNAPLIAGPWCRESFCPAAGTCPAYRAYAKRAAQMEFAQAPIDTLSDEALSGILDESEMIRDWIAAVWAEATRRAEAGEAPPGYKMVPKRALRRWVGEPLAVAKKLMGHFGLSEEQVYAEPKLKSPAQLEKLVSKPERQEMANFYAAISSGSVLARVDDPRRAVHRSTALEDFGAD